MKNFDPFQIFNSFILCELTIHPDEINQTILLLKSNRKPTEQTTSYNHLNVLNFPILKNLKSQVITILEKNNLILTNNWAQMYNKKDKHSIHVHNQSFYSGIIYLNPEKPSPTIFHERNFEMKYVHEGVKNTLLLFPSYIPHEVEPLEEDQDRLIISFNASRRV